MLINLSIHSKNSNSLTNFLKFLYRLEASKLFNLQLHIMQSQKKKKRIFFSVLKSPHVNKKAQEQFEQLTYGKKLKINVLKLTQFLIICKIVQTKVFYDIDLKIKFLSNGETSCQYLASNKIDSDAFLLKQIMDKNFSFSNFTEQNLLTILDIQGEVLLKNLYKSLDSSAGRAKD